MSTLAADGTNSLDIGDLNVYSYHPYFAFNFGEMGARVRPYLMIGMGATHYSSVDFFALGAQRTIPGQTQFSTTWGAGVKVYPSPHFGVRFGAAVDAHLHQDRRRGLVVRSVLGLLPHRRSAVLESVSDLRRCDHEV
jgi:hypothetical protein